MTYRERREARAVRLRGWAEKREAAAEATLHSQPELRHDWAFITQPGHIPERARMIARDDRAHESLKVADGMTNRAANIERQLDRAIYNDDPDAMERLTEKLATLTAERDAMKAANLAYRSDKVHRMELAALTSSYQRDLAMPHQSFELSNIGATIRATAKRIEALAHPVRRAITARRDGDCPDCDEPIRAGKVTIVEVEPGTWVHASCAEQRG